MGNSNSAKKVELIEKCHSFAKYLLPRILTQISRDRNLPLTGCGDRNYWHYKIRDFSSLIIQQAGYTAWKAAKFAGYPESSLRQLAMDSCIFWNRRAVMFRAFEEYYPWEEGYPPLAFSTLSTIKLVDEGVVKLEDVLPGLKVAARQLLSRFEAQATNQQMAGTAALCYIHKIMPELVPSDLLEKIIVKTLACQQEEGWFMEYGGSDLGYLSVTMDCLWDAYDASGDERFVKAASKALRFIAIFFDLTPRGIGMHNARNTDYVVPYGIARFLKVQEYFQIAANLIFRLLDQIDQPGHFFHAIDDRYWCHYIGHSFYRTLPLLEFLPDDIVYSNHAESGFRRLEGSGHILQYSPRPFPAIISTLKGGILTLFDRNGKTFSDFGWIILSHGEIWTNHWFSNSWNIRVGENRVEIKGYLSRHSYLKNTPVRHICLRVLSFCFGRRIIACLKNKMIFKKDESKFPFSREILFDKEKVIVNDYFSLFPEARIMRAPRASQRHVASADSFHYEDFSLKENGSQISRHEKVESAGFEYRITTIYSYVGE